MLFVVGRLLLHPYPLYTVSSGCEKVVKVWCLESMVCLHTLSYVDRCLFNRWRLSITDGILHRFTNVSQPKVALNKKYLLISTTDHVDVWDGKDDSNKFKKFFERIIFCSNTSLERGKENKKSASSRANC